jgi:hypothetical protein
MTPRTGIKPIDNYVVRYRGSEWDYGSFASVTPAQAGVQIDGRPGFRPEFTPDLIRGRNDAT